MGNGDDLKHIADDPPDDQVPRVADAAYACRNPHPAMAEMIVNAPFDQGGTGALKVQKQIPDRLFDQGFVPLARIGPEPGFGCLENPGELATGRSRDPNTCDGHAPPSDFR